MIKHIELSGTELKKMILTGKIRLAGHAKFKIYGTLTCASGKKMKKLNRVFFQNEHEALKSGFRPCGHCLYQKYLLWISKKQDKNRTSNKY